VPDSRHSSEAEEEDDEDAELDAEMMSQLRAEGAAANRGRGGGGAAALAAAAARRRAFEQGLPPLKENVHVGGRRAWAAGRLRGSSIALEAAVAAANGARPALQPHLAGSASYLTQPLPYPHPRPPQAGVKGMRVYGLSSEERGAFLEAFMAYGLRPAASGDPADVFRRLGQAVPGKSLKHVSRCLGKGRRFSTAAFPQVPTHSLGG
jgi:hypothetical protein